MKEIYFYNQNKKVHAKLKAVIRKIDHQILQSQLPSRSGTFETSIWIAYIGSEAGITAHFKPIDSRISVCDSDLHELNRPVSPSWVVLVLFC